MIQKQSIEGRTIFLEPRTGRKLPNVVLTVAFRLKMSCWISLSSAFTTEDVWTLRAPVLAWKRLERVCELR